MKLNSLWQDGLKYHWQWYKYFFSLSYIRYFGTWFAIAPSIAIIVENASNNNSFCINNACVQYHFDLPFSWWILWVSSLLFIFSFALYQYFCPKFIKDYSSYADYEAARHSPRWAVWESLYLLEDARACPGAYDIDKFVSRLIEKKYAQKTQEDISEPQVDVFERQSVLKFAHAGSSYEMSMPKFCSTGEETSIDNVATYEVVWEIFGRRASSYKGIRMLIFVLIKLTWLAVLFTIAQNIWSTANLLYKQLLSS